MMFLLALPVLKKSRVLLSEQVLMKPEMFFKWHEINGVHEMKLHCL